MGLLARLFGSEVETQRPVAELKSSSTDDLFWGDFERTQRSVTGVSVNQTTALSASAVLACVTMLSEDVAKLPWSVFRKGDAGAPEEATNHFLYELLDQPNEWQNGFEFREQMQVGLILRGNAYAVIIRNNRGIPIRLIPLNPDWVAVWISSVDGSLWYYITTQDLHARAMLEGLPNPISAEDMLHIRGFSSNGLVGSSRIRVARESIALSMAQEQQAAHWMGSGAKPSGMLTTDAKLSPETAKRLKEDIRENWQGLQNSGKMIIGEQGLKFLPFSMTSADLEFIASRKFQIEEIARIFRVPLHMIGELDRSTNNNIQQQAQEYINFTLTGYTLRWQQKIAQTFGLRKQGVYVDFDYRALTRADITSRIMDWRTAIMSMIATPNEARADLGMSKMDNPEADELQQPMNMAPQGSQSSGTAPDGGGRPSADDAPKISIEPRPDQTLNSIRAESP